MLWAKTFFPFSERQTNGVGWWGGGVETSTAAANLQATGLLEAPGMLSVVPGPPDCGEAHYSCAEGRDRQKPHQVAAVMGPAGRIWG